MTVYLFAKCYICIKYVPEIKPRILHGLSNGSTLEIYPAPLGCSLNRYTRIRRTLEPLEKRWGGVEQWETYFTLRIILNFLNFDLATYV